jgi:hypothetical protein
MTVKSVLSVRLSVASDRLSRVAYNNIYEVQYVYFDLTVISVKLRREIPCTVSAAGSRYLLGTS